MDRMSWNDYFMNLAVLASERSTCKRLKVGCVLVKDKRVIATAYNGSVSGTDHCEDKECDVVDNHCIRTIHSEVNAIIQCAKYGVSTDGCDIYVTHFPCYNCAKVIAQSGIKKVYYRNGYNNDQRTIDLFNQLKIECIQIK